MKKPRKILLVLAVLSVLALAAFRICDDRPVFEGDTHKGPDRYALAFTQMNGEDSHDLALREGDTLRVEVTVDRGRVDLFVGLPGEEPLYRGNAVDTGAFDLTVPKAGEYRITVQAKHAAGRISVCS